MAKVIVGQPPKQCLPLVPTLRNVAPVLTVHGHPVAILPSPDAKPQRKYKLVLPLTMVSVTVGQLSKRYLYPLQIFPNAHLANTAIGPILRLVPHLATEELKPSLELF